MLVKVEKVLVPGKKTEWGGDVQYDIRHCMFCIRLTVWERFFG